MDGNEIWEILFGIMEGNVPAELTVDVLDKLAKAINTIIEAGPEPTG